MQPLICKLSEDSFVSVFVLLSHFQGFETNIGPFKPSCRGRKYFSEEFPNKF